jgi:polyhydroxybutyrate depolymerase
MFPARGCEIVTPPGASDGERLPVVMLLHGFQITPEVAADDGGWVQAAASRRFVLVVPVGQGLSWNAGGCCPVASATFVDDFAYLNAVLDQIDSRVEVDPERVAVVGFSNGGMMAHAFGCAASPRVMGIVSVAGTPVHSCNPVEPRPVLHVHGTGDQTVPYAGGSSLVSAQMGVSFPSASGAMAGVAASMGCDPEPIDSVAGSVATRDWRGCEEGPVRFVSLQGAEHAWPEGGPYDATDEVLDFLGIDAPPAAATVGDACVDARSS